MVPTSTNCTAPTLPHNFGIQTLIDGLRVRVAENNSRWCSSSVESGGEGLDPCATLAPSSQRPQGSR